MAISAQTLIANGVNPAYAASLAQQINSLDPSVQDRFAATVVDFYQTHGSQGYDLDINQAARTAAEQQAIRASGVKAASPRNTWHVGGGAVDFTVYKDGKRDKGTKAGNAYETVLAPIARRNGLNNPIRNDVGHFQPKEVTKARGGQVVSQVIDPNVKTYASLFGREPLAETPKPAQAPFAVAGLAPDAFAQLTTPPAPSQIAAVEPPASLPVVQAALQRDEPVDDLSLGRVDAPRGNVQVLERVDIPAGPYRSDDIVRAAMNNDAAGLNRAWLMTITLSQMDVLGKHGGATAVGEYLGTLAEKAPGAARIAQSNYAANPKLLEAVPVTVSALVAKAMAEAPPMPPRVTVEMPLPTPRPAMATPQVAVAGPPPVPVAPSYQNREPRPFGPVASPYPQMEPRSFGPVAPAYPSMEPRSFAPVADAYPSREPRSFVSNGMYPNLGLTPREYSQEEITRINGVTPRGMAVWNYGDAIFDIGGIGSDSRFRENINHTSWPMKPGEYAPSFWPEPKAGGIGSDWAQARTGGLPRETYATKSPTSTGMSPVDDYELRRPAAPTEVYKEARAPAAIYAPEAAPKASGFAQSGIAPDAFKALTGGTLPTLQGMFGGPVATPAPAAAKSPPAARPATASFRAPTSRPLEITVSKPVARPGQPSMGMLPGVGRTSDEYVRPSNGMYPSWAQGPMSVPGASFSPASFNPISGGSNYDYVTSPGQTTYQTNGGTTWTIDTSNQGPGSGSTVLCSWFYKRGRLSRNLWLADARFAQKTYSEQTIRGYHAWAVPTVASIKSGNRILEAVLWPIVKSWAHEIGYQMGVRQHPSFAGKLVRLVLEPVSWLIGGFVGRQDWQRLYRKA